MLGMLAQQRQNPIENLFETITSIFSRGDALAHPDAIIEHLQALSIVWATIFVIVGLLCLLNGYKFYRTAVVGVALLLGMFAGYYLGRKIGAPYVIAACLGALLAVAAFPMLKYAVAVLGGLTGAFVGANLWTGFAHALNKVSGTEIPPETFWIGAMVGLLICGMLAFILFKLSIVMFTAVSGSTLAVLGAIALMLSFDPLADTITERLTAHPLVIPLLVFVPAIIGLILQERGSMKNGVSLNAEGETSS